MSELTELSATELAVRIGRREISAAEVAEASLSRVRDYNPALNAIVTLNPGFVEVPAE